VWCVLPRLFIFSRLINSMDSFWRSYWILVVVSSQDWLRVHHKQFFLISTIAINKLLFNGSWSTSIRLLLWNFNSLIITLKLVFLFRKIITLIKSLPLTIIFITLLNYFRVIIGWGFFIFIIIVAVEIYRVVLPYCLSALFSIYLSKPLWWPRTIILLFAPLDTVIVVLLVKVSFDFVSFWQFSPILKSHILHDILTKDLTSALLTGMSAISQSVSVWFFVQTLQS
jgi:hypothetical protein